MCKRVGRFFRYSFWLVKRHPLLFLAVVSFLLCAENVVFGKYSLCKLHDKMDILFTLHRNTLTDFFAKWFPYQGCGVDGISVTRSPFVAYRLFCLVFPEFFSSFLITFGSTFLLASGIFMCGRKIFRLKRSYCILGAFGGIVMFLPRQWDLGYQFSVGAFPYLILLFDSVRTSGRWWASLWAAALFGSVLGATSLFPITMPFAGICALLWSIVFRGRSTLRFWAYFGIFWVAVILVSLSDLMVLFMPAYESHRTEFKLSFDFWSQAGRLFELHWFQLNLVQIFLLFALYNGYKRRRPLFVATLVLMVVNFAVPLLFATMCQFGVAGKANFSRTDIFSSTFLGFVFALGFAAIGYGLSPAKRRIYIVACMIFMSGYVVVAKVQNAIIDYRGLPLHSYYYDTHERACSKLAELDDKSGLWRGVMVGEDKWNAASYHGFEMASGYLLNYSLRFKHYWKRVLSGFAQKRPSRFRKFLNWGSRVHLFDPEPEDSKASLVFGDYYDLKLLSLANTKYVFSQHPLVDSDLILIYKPEHPYLDIKSRKEKLKLCVEMLCGIAPEPDNYYLYRNEKCLPRFFLAGDIRTFENEKNLLDALAQTSTEDMRRTVLLEEKYKPEMKFAPSEQSSVTLVEYSADEIKLQVSCAENSILVVSNTYSRYWRCKVNGQDVKVLPAYGTFWAVPLAKGDAEVVFSYCPPWPSL